jgi:hypothetical protein
MSDFWRKSGHPPGHPELKFWTTDEDAILGTDTDVKIAQFLGRPHQGVVGRRMKLGIPAFLVEIAGKHLARLREKAAITRNGLAVLARTDRTTIANLEKGTTASALSHFDFRMSVFGSPFIYRIFRDLKP